MILVTGATGLVGAYLCMALAEKEEKVVALYRTQKKKGMRRASFSHESKKSLTEKYRVAKRGHYPSA